MSEDRSSRWWWPASRVTGIYFAASIVGVFVLVRFSWREALVDAWFGAIGWYVLWLVLWGLVRYLAGERPVDRPSMWWPESIWGRALMVVYLLLAFLSGLRATELQEGSLLKAVGSCGVMYVVYVPFRGLFVGWYVLGRRRDTKDPTDE
jgi:hypothetical protein